MEDLKPHFNGNNIVSPPPEVWDNIVKRIRKERKRNIIKVTVVILFVGLSAGLGIYRLANKAVSSSPTVASAKVEQTQHRHYVEIAKDLETYHRRYPDNPILKLRRRAIESKLNEYTTLTSAGVWRW